MSIPYITVTNLTEQPNSLLADDLLEMATERDTLLTMLRAWTNALEGINIMVLNNKPLFKIYRDTLIKLNKGMNKD